MKQVLTVSCKLQVTPEQSIKIDATLQAFANACECVNQTVPPTLTNELAMQPLVYHNVRDMFRLSAQLAIHAIRRVSGNRKTAQKDGSQSAALLLLASLTLPVSFLLGKKIGQ